MSSTPWAVKSGTNQRLTPLRHPDNRVLLINLGREHDDTPLIAEALAHDHEFRVDRINLNKTDFSKIDFSTVSAVDLKDCRGWQQDFSKFQRQMKILEEKIKETNREIPIINPPKMFDWIASKEYMREFQNKGIPIVPTKFVHRGEAWPDIFAMMDANADKRIVLKPARGSRASNILFIKKLDDDAFEMTCPKPLDDKSPTPRSIIFTKKVLEDRLKGYEQEMFWGDQQPAILIQPYCRGKEISAVLIGKTNGSRKAAAHFVERTLGVDNPETPEIKNLVAHEDFGGINLPQSHPDPAVVAFAERVKSALPPELADAPYARIDMLHEEGKQPILLEVEAGSARLFLIETQRTNEYADMVAQCVIDARRKSRLAQRQPIALQG